MLSDSNTLHNVINMQVGSYVYFARDNGKETNLQIFIYSV